MQIFFLKRLPWQKAKADKVDFEYTQSYRLPPVHDRTICKIFILNTNADQFQDYIFTMHRKKKIPTVLKGEGTVIFKGGLFVS